MILLFMLDVLFLVFMFSYYVYRTMLKKSQGNKKMKDVADLIRKNSFLFLFREYKTLSIFVIFLGLLIILFLDNPNTQINEGLIISISFFVGAVCSAFAGFIGMHIATLANVRTANAARKGYVALEFAFKFALVIGLTIVSLGLFGLISLYYIFSNYFLLSIFEIVSLIAGFSFGASLVALFARVGGGIFTKAADMGADLVGKIEKLIPEDDFRNPAVIADNVGDNIGDVAGMSADLFESYVGSIVATMILGVTLGEKFVVFPLAIALLGIISSIFGSFFVKVGRKVKIHGILRKGVVYSAIIILIGSYFLTKYLMDSFAVYYSILIGLIIGLVISLLTEYFTSKEFKPVINLSKIAKSGSATLILEGISLGFLTTFFFVLIISIGIYLSYLNFGFYGVAISSVGLMSILGINLAIDVYGPIADNASGIVQMSGLSKSVKKITNNLDSVGNTTAAIGKGFAITSATLTSFALLIAFTKTANVEIINLLQPNVFIGILIGGMLPFLFSSLIINSVTKATFKMIEEVRRQFKEIPGLLKGKAQPNYEACIDISTKFSLREMLLPGVIAVLAPILIGLTLGVSALTGLLVGSLVTGMLLAIFMANSGGAWDNAKKLIENIGGKHSYVYNASILGDLVGDPFKDSCGPALNILIKLMSIVALVFLPLFI